MEYIGYAKYQGKHIRNGIFGIRESATALNGFDEVFRYFLIKEEPLFTKVKFDLPVKIEEGSWEILIPENISQIMQISAGVIAGCSLKKYFETIAQTAAKDGLFQTGPVKDIKLIFQKTFQAIQWAIKIFSHMKDMRKNFAHTKITNNESVILKNDDGEELIVPIAIFHFIEKCPVNIFSRLASIVSTEQELEIGVKINNIIETVKITEKNKYIFWTEETEEENILPELKDGDEVTLTGLVTRANEAAQSIGFLYQNHIITCKPEAGKFLADFKNALISQNHKHLYVPQMKLTGIVERRTPTGEDKDRIRIFFSQLESEDTLEEEDNTPSLL